MNIGIQSIYEQYKHDVYAYLLSLTHSVPLSEDLTSEVFLSAIKSLSGFKGKSSIKTWLFSIARYKWYEQLRKNKKALAPEELMSIYLTDTASAEAVIISKELANRIHELLVLESERNREVVLMRVEGYSYYEIAQKHHISESSARVLDFRTKNKIRAILLKEGYGDE